MSLSIEIEDDRQLAEAERCVAVFDAFQRELRAMRKVLPFSDRSIIKQRLFELDALLLRDLRAEIERYRNR